MDCANYWLLTIMHEGSCRRSWAVCGLELRYLFLKSFWGWIPKETSSIRDHLVNLLIASYSIRWSIDANLGSFGSFGLGLQKSVHHSGQTKDDHRFHWDHSLLSTLFTLQVCLEHPADTAVVPCTLDRRGQPWPCFRQFRFGAAGGHLCACDGCMTQVMAAEQLVCTKKHRPC